MRYLPLVPLVAASVLAASLLLATTAFAKEDTNSPLFTPDPSGVLATVSTRPGRVIDTSNAFFQRLGTNGRACVTCHVPDQAWSISSPDIQQRFEFSGGTDPLFRTNDGANAPNADVATVAARRAAYSMLLSKGLIRVGIGIPAGAEFELAAVDDPYHFASAHELSLFRRPLPSTNLGFLNAVMWDGRETLQKLLPTNTPQQNLAALRFDLADQANGATRGHAQASHDLSPDQQRQIVDFELALSTAQFIDTHAGPLAFFGAQGGPRALSQHPFFVGINDLVVKRTTTPPTVLPPNPGMTLFSAWAGQPGILGEQAVARGQALFNTRPITITGVAGLNDALDMPAIRGTCATCHDTPNVGNHSVAAPLNIGTADASRRTPDQPLYTLRNTATGQTVQTTDPGRALVTGQWADIGKVKGPVLRGLAARAPYFHNGSAASLDGVVDFYNSRFNIGLSARERADLVPFLRSL